MITSLFLMLTAPGVQQPALYIQGEDHIEWVSALQPGENWVLLPQAAHGDRRPRAIPGPRGIEVLISAPEGCQVDISSLRASAISHSPDERVLLTGEELRIASEISLPASARRLDDGRDRLPQLARLDLEGCTDETLRIAKGPPSHDLILIPVESPATGTWSLGARSGTGEPGKLTGSRGHGYALRLDGSLEWELSVDRDGLDRVFHAHTRPLTADLRDTLELLEINRQAQSSWEWRARGERGPLHPHPRSVPQDLTELSLNTWPLELTSGQLLHLRYPAPVSQEDEQTHTLILRIEVGIERTAREASTLSPSHSTPGFRDVTAPAGLADVHFEGPEEQLDIRPTMGPGAAWGDFDGDGLVDLYVVQGGGREGCTPPLNRLMRNLGDGRFEVFPGAEDSGNGMGALFFDLEGDGDLDLYVANYGPDALYRNDGEEGFVAVSADHDLAGDGWSAGVCAADYDGDGDLDLYVTTYLLYDTELMPEVPEYPGYAREDPVEMLPFAFPGGRNTFLENNDGHLTDRTEELGLADVAGRGMQPIFWDFDLDGDQDLYIANDVSMNVLFRNEGNGKFEDISFQTGMDDPRGGMGVATGDVDLDGDQDLFLTNWQLEANALYRNNLIVGSRRRSRTGTFQDVTVHARLGRHGVGFTSWGCVFFDADNDMDLDLFVPNGYTSPDYESTDICVGQSNQFFLNDGRGRFVEANEIAGPAVRAALASRAAAVCDFDRDGRLDLFVTNNNGPYQLLRNELPSKGHWLGLQLSGSGANTQALGARVELEVDGLVLTREVSAGSGYLAGHDPGVHFGLGPSNEVDSLRVHWPSGRTTRHEVSEVDCWISLEEPSGPEENQPKRQG